MKRIITHQINVSTSENFEYNNQHGLLRSFCDEKVTCYLSAVFQCLALKKSEVRNLILIMMLTSLVSARIFGQDPVKNLYTAGHIVNPPAIDGILDDYAWTEGIWCADFTQYEPYNKKPVSQKTEFKILFDDNNIYVAVKAFDTHRDSIVRRLTRKDQVEGDVIAVVFDSYHDLRTGFFFGVSAAGVKYDLVYTNDGQNQDPTWDPDWWVRTSINDNGWVAEMKIPLSQIRFKKNSADKWGLQVARLIYRKNEFDYWQHIPKDAPGLIHMFGELNGLERIIPRKIFDITPYLLSRVETYKAERENPFRSSGRNYSYNAGVDSKIGVTNNITLDLTFNPDFGQVEADPSVVNLSAFETFYKEQRPFFVEGNNITDFNIGTGDSGVGNDNLFYSRRIGRAPQCNPSGLKSGWIAEAPSFTGIIGAAKLTGKTKNGLSVGIIDAVTNEEKAVIDTLGGKIYIPVEPLSNYFVGRMQKDYNSGNSIIGGIITGTNRMMDSTLSSFLHRAAYTGGVDLTQYFYNKNWMLNFNAAISSVEGSREAIKITQESSARYFQRPDNIYVKFDTMKRTLTGSGGKLQVMKLNGHLNLKGAFLWKTPGFEANDLGYIRQADQLYGILAAGYNQWKPKGIYNRYSINCDIYSLYDFGGNNLSNAIEQNANMTFKNYWNAYISGSATTDQLSSTLLRGGPLMKIPGSWQVQYGFSTDNRRRLILSVNSGRSGQYQKSSVSGFLNINVQYKPTNYLMVAFGPQSSTSDDNLQYITTVNYNNGKRYVFSTIHQKTISASFRVNINLLPDLSIQYWGQPFLASGKYSEYKYITNPTATRYIDRYHVYSGTQISGNGNGFNVDENCDGKTDYQLGVSNFSYQSFMSNLVVRWEYSPGSSVFFVWNQTRNGYDNSGNLDSDCLNSLFKMKPVNIFLIKFSYRFGLMFK